MKRLALTLLVCLLIPALSYGGEIKGTIYIGNETVDGGTKVEITFGAKKYTTMTSQDGFYRLMVTETGRCRLRLADIPDLTIWIDSSTRSQRLNLKIVEIGRDKYALRRK